MNTARAEEIIDTLAQAARPLTRYALVSYADANDVLIDAMAVPVSDVKNHQKRAPRVYSGAEVEATDPHTAYYWLFFAMCTIKAPEVERFWTRVYRVPRIRVAAIRHIGLRNLRGVLQHVYSPASEEGTMVRLDT